MEFKKIDETKFQCLLREEDLEDNHISLDDFFRNDTAKIHGLLDVVMEEAQKNIGVIMTGGVMSLQLAPQPNHSILLTISSGKEEFGDMLRQAGERAAQAVSSLKLGKENTENVIKKEDGQNIQAKAAPFKQTEEAVSDEKHFAVDAAGQAVGSEAVICKLSCMRDLEQFCANAPKTWGIKNALYKNTDSGEMFLVLERGRSARARYEQFINGLLEYGEFIAFKMERMAYIREHYDLIIASNAVNIIRKYCI